MPCPVVFFLLSLEHLVGRRTMWDKAVYIRRKFPAHTARVVLEIWGPAACQRLAACWAAGGAGAAAAAAPKEEEKVEEEEEEVRQPGLCFAGIIPRAVLSPFWAAVLCG